MYDALQSNWGDAPSRTVDRQYPDVSTLEDWEPNLAHMGWWKLDPHEKEYVESCFAGRTLQQVLEGITFDFVINGVSRAFTHQNVRTRLGAGFMQHGGRDNDWRHRAWTMPETIRRAIGPEIPEKAPWDGLLGKARSEAKKKFFDDWRTSEGDLKHCIVDWGPIDSLIATHLGDRRGGLREVLTDYLKFGRELYAALVDAGIPWQDARRVLFMGMQTYIHDQYNYLALNGVLANRLEHIMDWEFNCVAQLMLREVKMKCPPIFSKYLGSHSDKAKAAKFVGLESWPPDRKYPSPYDICKRCGHKVTAHVAYETATKISPSLKVMPGEMVCGECAMESDAAVSPMHVCVTEDSLPRQHRPEQMPFFVLHPDSMAGGPIQWIPTNGSYPHEEIARVTAKR